MFQHPPWWKRSRPNLSMVGIATALVEFHILDARRQALEGNKRVFNSGRVVERTLADGSVMLHTPDDWPSYYAGPDGTNVLEWTN